MAASGRKIIMTNQRRGHPYLLKVAEEGHDQVVHELIRVGAEVDVQDNTKTFQHFHSDPR